MEEKKKFIIYNGRKYYENKGYYIYSERLHRRIWEDAYGPIPEDHHIHHKNGDNTDNRLENLECILKRDHHLKHFDKEKQLKILHSPEISEKAHRWHKTAKAKKELGKFSKKQWENRKPIERVCVICSKQFLTKNFTGTKYCSQPCRSRSYMMRNVYVKNCQVCGKEFLPGDTRNLAKSCSPKCKGILISRTKKGDVSDSLPAT